MTAPTTMINSTQSRQFVDSITADMASRQYVDAITADLRLETAVAAQVEKLRVDSLVAANAELFAKVDALAAAKPRDLVAEGLTILMEESDSPNNPASRLASRQYVDSLAIDIKSSVLDEIRAQRLSNRIARWFCVMFNGIEEK